MLRQRIKPSKTVSKFGFFVGLLFCLFGVFMILSSGLLTGTFIVVPFFLLWTGIAGFITYTHYKNGFTDEGIAMYDIETPEDFEEKIRKLQRLREDGLITEEEFFSKREAIMREKW